VDEEWEGGWARARGEAGDEAEEPETVLGHILSLDFM
jgi:hypothetical protein